MPIPEGTGRPGPPQPDQVIRLTEEGFDSGDCFIDQIEQSRGLYVLRGLSVPSGAKEPRFPQLGAADPPAAGGRCGSGAGVYAGGL